MAAAAVAAAVAAAAVAAVAAAMLEWCVRAQGPSDPWHCMHLNAGRRAGAGAWGVVGARRVCAGAALVDAGGRAHRCRDQGALLLLPLLLLLLLLLRRWVCSVTRRRAQARNRPEGSALYEITSEGFRGVNRKRREPPA